MGRLDVSIIPHHYVVRLLLLRHNQVSTNVFSLYIWDKV